MSKPESSVPIGVGSALGHNIWGYLRGKAAKSSGKFWKIPSENNLIVQKKSSGCVAWNPRVCGNFLFFLLM